MKKITATIVLMSIFLVGITTAKSGTSTGDYQSDNVRKTCKQSDGKATNTNSDWAIFVTCLTGIIYSGFLSNMMVVNVPGRSKTSSDCLP